MTERLLWVIQQNLGSATDIRLMVTALEKHNIDFKLIDAVPFSDQLPDVPNDRPVIFYGSTNFIQTIHKSAKWQPGAFVNESFEYSEYDRHYGERLFNHGSMSTTVGEFAAKHHAPEKAFFIRPEADTKDFAGRVMQFDDIVQWEARLRDHCPSVTPETRIIVGEPYNIAHEWRLFIINGVVCSGSHYRRYGKLTVAPEVPERVIAFAEETAQIWSPCDIFVMDIGESGGDLYIIELGSFNSAGFYASDIEKIVVEITNAAIVGLNQE